MSVLGLLAANALMALVGATLLWTLGLLDVRTRFGAAYLAGLALTGVVTATLAVVRVPVSLVTPAVLAAALAAAGARRSQPLRAPRAPAATARVDRAVARLFGAALALAAVGTVWVMRAKPIASEYDAWAIWAMKAHALASLGVADPVLFASHAYRFSNLDYPLFVPSVEALGIRAAGGYASNLVVLQCVLFGIAGILALWSLLADRVRPLVLWPALAAIAAAPNVLLDLGTAYADMPLAFMVAAGVVAGARWLLDRRDAWLATATVFLAAATLSKAEGLLFAAAAYVALVVVASGSRRRVLVSTGAVALVLLPWRVFVSVHHLTPSFYKLSDSFRVVWVAHRIGRAPTALWALLTNSATLREFALLPLVCAAAAVFAWLRGAHRLLLFGLVFTALSYVGLTWIFVISRAPLHDYLSQTQERIIDSVVVTAAALAPLLVDQGERDPTP